MLSQQSFQILPLEELHHNESALIDVKFTFNSDQIWVLISFLYHLFKTRFVWIKLGLFNLFDGLKLIVWALECKVNFTLASMGKIGSILINLTKSKSLHHFGFFWLGTRQILFFWRKDIILMLYKVSLILIFDQPSFLNLRCRTWCACWFSFNFSPNYIQNLIKVISHS